MNTGTSISARAQNENWLPILELALQEVFEIMLGCRLEPAAGSEQRTGGEITAMVGLAGSACGVLTVCCSARAAAAVATHMLGAETVRSEDHVWDALGELCNMIAGNFKSKLSGVDGTCMLSVPTVITGGEYSFHALADGGSLETTMLFEGMPIIVRLDLHS
jgi:chemotaxis protein CheX